MSIVNSLFQLLSALTYVGKVALKVDRQENVIEDASQNQE